MPRKPTPLPRSARRIALLALLPLALPAAVRAGEHDHHHHHHHVAAPSSATISRSETRLTLPKVALKTQDGKAVALPELIDDGRPVLLNFIYTSCTAICPPMTAATATIAAAIIGMTARPAAPLALPWARRRRSMPASRPRVIVPRASVEAMPRCAAWTRRARPARMAGRSTGGSSYAATIRTRAVKPDAFPAT